MKTRGRWATRYTVMVVPEGVSRVRRFQVRGKALQRGIAVAAVALLLVLLGTADWVRLRTDAVDVSALRAETTMQREQIERFRGELEHLEKQLSRLSEFERKVRVIANLPKAAVEHTAGDEDAPAVGGGADDDGLRETPPAAPGLLAPSAAREPSGERMSWEDWRPRLEPRAELAAVGHLRARARRLREHGLMQETSLSELVDQLDGKSRQLASTPSIWPTEGWITSRYGRRISPFTGRPQFHAGVDIAAHFGTRVVAPARGRVTFVGRKGALGRTVVLDHGYGIRTSYGHLAKVDVRKGQEVERGEPVGAVGSSGRSTGPHLHYAVDVRGKSVDPLDYVFE